MQPFDSRQADEVATLLALAEHGSFAAAGRALQRHPSVLSKRLGALERRLGIRLVERTTRQLRFTDEGERLASRFRQAVDLLDEAEHEASLGAAQLRGRLRIALPSAMGRLWLGPLLAEFALAHPQVVLETDYSERFVDIIAEGFDLAIRVGELADSRLVARRLCAHRRILGAAPDYLERHGVPRIPADLAAHNCLGFSGLHSYPEWKLTRQDEQQPVRVRGSMVSNGALRHGGGQRVPPMGGSAVRRWPALAAPAGLSGIRERLAEERAASRPSLPDNPDTLPPACG